MHTELKITRTYRPFHAHTINGVIGLSHTADNQIANLGPNGMNQ